MHTLLFAVHLIATIAAVTGVGLLARRGLLPDLVKSPWWGAALLAAAAAFVFVMLKASSPPAFFWDYINAYHPAGQAALARDSQRLRELIAVGAYGGFVNIPGYAYLFAPFALLPPNAAALAFSLVGILSAAWAWWMLVHLAQLKQRERWLLAILFIASGPLLNAVKFGNNSYFLILAFAGGLALLRAERPVWAGVVLGLAAVTKPSLALFGFFFLFRRDFRGLAGFAATGVAAVVFSLLTFGWDLNLYWFENSVLKYSQSWLADFSVQSIPAFLDRLSMGSGVSDWSPKPPAPVEKLVAQGLAAIIIAVAAFAGWKSGGEKRLDAETRRTLQYILVICLSVAASPLSWAHYYAWLLVPAAYFLAWRESLSKSDQYLLWAGVALITPLVTWIPPEARAHLPAIYTSLLASHYFFGGLIWFALVVRRLVNAPA